MPGQLKYHLWLHGVVFIYGFTAILGKLITVSALTLVWWRLLIAVAGLYLILRALRAPVRLPPRDLLLLGATGCIVAAHWVFFFGSIKASTVSLALVCFSTTAMFTALIEPAVFRRPVRGYEVVFGALVVLGLYFIVRVETGHALGAAYAVLAAALASLFTVLNARFVRRIDPRTISFYELAGGICGLSIYLGASGGFHTGHFALAPADVLYLLILGLVCTAFAFVSAVNIMRVLSPFTVSLTVNLEPVYGILLALLIFGEEERMTPQFYAGAALILTTVFANAWIKRRAAMRQFRETR